MSCVRKNFPAKNKQWKNYLWFLRHSIRVVMHQYHLPDSTTFEMYSSLNSADSECRQRTKVTVAPSLKVYSIGILWSSTKQKNKLFLPWMLGFVRTLMIFFFWNCRSAPTCRYHTYRYDFLCSLRRAHLEHNMQLFELFLRFVVEPKYLAVLDVAI